MSIRFTNRHSIPHALARAIEHDDKVTWGQYSVTQLIAPPRIRWLLKRNEVEVDVSERVGALLGKAVHSLIEPHADANAGVEPEQTIVGRVGDVMVSGTIDSMERQGKSGLFIIRDWKTTSVASFGQAPKVEWVQQLNCYAWLAESASMRKRDDHTFAERPTVIVGGIAITSVYRDWSMARALRATGGSYPPAPVDTKFLPLWSTEEQDRYLRERVALHVAADESDEIPALCTDAERWAKPTTFAVVKDGAKRAMRGGIHSRLEDAIAFASHHAPGKSVIEHRHGEDTRCLHYCPARAVCSHGIDVRKNLESSVDGSDPVE